MSDLIDPRTVIFMASLLGGLMSVVLELFSRNASELVPGLRQWTNASWVIFVTAFLFGLRGVLPDVLAVTLANAMLLAACVLMLHGTHLFLGHSPRWPFWGAVFGASMLGLVWFTHVDPSFRGRTVSMVGSLGLIMAAQARLYFRAPMHTLGTRFIGATLILMTVIFTSRWLHAIGVAQDDAHLFAKTWAQLAYMTSYTIVLLLIMVGYLLLATERVREVFEYQARHDALTGIFNRREILERTNKEIKRSQRYQTPLALLVLDLDHFKQVNDVHGHQAGDDVLKQFVQRVGGCLRPNDLFGRMGGEEFLLVLPHTSVDAALALASRLLPVVAEGGSPLPVCTVSIGLTEWQPGDTSVDSLIARADSALYAAKALGRNRVELA